jgi:hypothetical protein
LLINIFDNCFFRSCNFLQLPHPPGANDSVARQTRRRSKRRDSLSAEQEKFQNQEVTFPLQEGFGQTLKPDFHPANL